MRLRCKIDEPAKHKVLSAIGCSQLSPVVSSRGKRTVNLSMKINAGLGLLAKRCFFRGKICRRDWRYDFQRRKIVVIEPTLKHKIDDVPISLVVHIGCHVLFRARRGQNGRVVGGLTYSKGFSVCLKPVNTPGNMFQYGLKFLSTPKYKDKGMKLKWHVTSDSYTNIVVYGLPTDTWRVSSVLPGTLSPVVQSSQVGFFIICGSNPSFAVCRHGSEGSST